MTHYQLAPANFEDYRDFLRERYESLRRQNSRYSLSACALKAKISKSLLQFVFQKKRHLGLDRMPTVSRALKLTPNEEYFVYLMICKNSSKSSAIQAHFEKILGRLRHEAVEVNERPIPLSTDNDKALYQNHLFMILQTLVRLPAFREDPAWIRENLLVPNITEAQILECLEELLRLKFIVRDESGRLRPKDKLVLWRPDPYDPDGHSVFTKAAEGMASLMQTPSVYKPSVYMSMSLAFDEDGLKQAEKIMIETHHRLSSIQSAAPTAVVQVANFMLAVARLKPENSNLG